MKIKTIQKVAIGLGVGLLVAAPVLTPAATTFAATATSSPNPTINAVIGETISLSVSGNVNINTTPGAGVATGTHDVEVTTNNSLGYRLEMSSSTAATTLTHTVTPANTIATAAATHASPAALPGDRWGYRIGSFATNTYAGVLASTAPVKPTLAESSAPVTAESTTVTWAVNVASALPSGTYSREITYTAITKV